MWVVAATWYRWALNSGESARRMGRFFSLGKKGFYSLIPHHIENELDSRVCRTRRAWRRKFPS
jgi:hypothetical protein